MNSPHTSQHGFALLVALIFLVILTLLSVTAMRTSTMELNMATNEQEQRLGFDSAQSAIDAVLASNQLTVTSPGAVYCYGFGATPNCGGTASNTNLLTNAGAGTDNFVRATLDSIGSCPRSIATSARGASSLRTTSTGGGATGNCAYFSVQSVYDATAKRGGRVETQQGYVKFIN